MILPQKEKTIFIRPIGGMWTADPADAIANEASPDMCNFMVYSGYLRKRPGYKQYGTGSNPGSRITGVYSAQETAGSRHLYATTAAGLYRYNVGTTVFDAMTGPALTGGVTDLFWFDVSQNNLVFCQGVDNVQALPLTGTVYAVINANCKPAKSGTRWNTRLYLGFTIEGAVNTPFRVRWSVFGDHTDWVGIGSGFLDVAADDVYHIVAIRKLMSQLAVHTEKGIWMGAKTGSAQGPAQFDLVVRDIGLLSRFSLRSYNVTEFFIGTDDFYAFNTIQAVPLLRGVRQYVYSLINPAAINQNFGEIMLDIQHYLGFIATGSNSVPDTIWAYNWERSISYPWCFDSGKFTSSGTHYLDSDVTISSLVGTIAQQGWIIGARTLTATFPLIVLGATDGKVYYLDSGLLSDNGVAINARWTSKDFTSGKDIDIAYGNKMVILKGVGFTYIDPGTAFTLNFYYSVDRGTTWSGPFAVTVGGVSASAIGDAMCTEQITGRRVRFKIENNAVNELPQIIEFRPQLEAAQQSIA